uniref:Putative organic cation/carnitine transporter n=1 Tax=Ornithodoros turicata TaxID=34597 RepID=A0A2R5LDJ6_9ACAR
MGPWHVPTLAFLFMRGFPLSFTILLLSFAAPKMDHWCARPSGFEEWTSEQWRNFAIPMEMHKGKMKPSKCAMYRIEITDSGPVALNETLSCTAWEYDTSFYKSNLVTEWDLVCDRSWYVSMSQSLFMGGLIAGNALFATLSDRFGRRTSLLFAVIIVTLSGLATVASPTFLVFNLIRLVTSLGVGGYQSTAVTIAMECISTKRRPILLLGALGWIAGCTALPWLSYAITDWVILQVVLSLSSLVLLALWFVLPESPRWLMTKGKLRRAEASLNDIAAKNKLENIDVPKMVDEQRKLVEKTSNAEHTVSFLDLFKGKRLRKKTILIFISYFANRLLMFHLTFFSVHLGGSPFVSFTMVILFSLPGCSVIPMLLIRYCRRRIGLSVSCFVTGFFILLLIPLTEDYLILRLLTTIIAKNAVNAGAGVLTVFGGEVFPTVVRTMGIGGGYMASRVGAMLAPFFKELANNTSPAVAAVVSAVVAIIGGLAAIMLPETLNKPLPDTLEDAEKEL